SSCPDASQRSCHVTPGNVARWPRKSRMALRGLCFSLSDCEKWLAVTSMISSAGAVLKSPRERGGRTGGGGGAGVSAVGAKLPGRTVLSLSWRRMRLVVGPFSRRLLPTLLPGTEHRLDVVGGVLGGPGRRLNGPGVVRCEFVDQVVQADDRVELGGAD